ncbi:MAG: hypothetical protein F6J87_27150, partial [Spirulina sp. SIO3F2]|nr:hypothetical protein [Spirulina sp. SIO3F2]
MFNFVDHSTPLDPFTARKRTDYRQALGRMLTVGLLILGLGFATVNHYGVSWDEGTEIAIVKYNVDWITEARPIPRDLKYYGLVFNGTTELLFQAKQWLANPRTYRPGQELAEGDRAITEALAQRIQFKHWLTFLWTMAAYGGVILIVVLLAGVRNAWFAAVVLVLMPRFWGHGFFNPKDIPFASLFTLATALGALLLGRYHQATAQLKGWTLGQRSRLWLWAGGYGIVLGLLSGVRIGGWVVLGFMLVAHLCSGGLRGLGSFGRLLRFYGTMLLTFALTTIAVYPAAWSNPIVWFWETNRYLSQHPWASQVLFQGDYWQ